MISSPMVFSRKLDNHVIYVRDQEFKYSGLDLSKIPSSLTILKSYGFSKYLFLYLCTILGLYSKEKDISSVNIKNKIKLYRPQQLHNQGILQHRGLLLVLPSSSLNVPSVQCNCHDYSLEDLQIYA